MAKKKKDKAGSIKEASAPKVSTLTNLGLFASLKEVVDTFKDDQIMTELLAIEYKLGKDVEYEKNILTFEAGILYALLILQHIKSKGLEA